MNFLDRLEFLKQKRELNNNTLSKQTGIPYTTIDGWYKRGCDRISLSTLQTLANFFNCSVDYLLGRSDEPIDDSVLDLVNEIDNDLLERYGNIYEALIAQTTRNRSFTTIEYETIKKYRALDEHGKKVVKSIFNQEYERCTTPSTRFIPLFLLDYYWYSFDEDCIQYSYRSRCEIPVGGIYDKADFAMMLTDSNHGPYYYPGNILLLQNQHYIAEGEEGIYSDENRRAVICFRRKGILTPVGDYYDPSFTFEAERDSFFILGKILGQLEIIGYLPHEEEANAQFRAARGGGIKSEPLPDNLVLDDDTSDLDS